MHCSNGQITHIFSSDTVSVTPAADEIDDDSDDDDDGGGVDDDDDDDVEPFCPGLFRRPPAAERVKNHHASVAPAGKICEHLNREIFLDFTKNITCFSCSSWKNM